MLDLFDPLLDLEGRHATDGELQLWHKPDYLTEARDRVVGASAVGRPVELQPGLVVSGASWDASTAAVGSVLTAIDAVTAGAVENAFCAVRPPARDAMPDAPGRWGLLNPVAVGVRYLLRHGIAERVLVVEWGEPPASAGIGAEENVRVARVDWSGNVVTSPEEAVRRAIGQELHGEFIPGFVLLSCGFDLPGDGSEREGEISSLSFYGATEAVRAVALQYAEGRLVSVLEGGYNSRLGRCAVQHLRALAGLPPHD
jgi:acetoin utilization deacetylase AcuC-like enzyme